MTNTAAEKKKKTWISIAIAAVIIIIVLGLAVVGGAAFWVYSHVSTKFVPTDTAAEEFARQRTRFAGQRPLIDIRSEDDEAVIHRNPEAPRRELRALHALAYDASSRKLVHIDLPAWVLRLMSKGGRIRFSEFDMFESDRQQLTLEDLERHGPGLILDVQRKRGSQVLVWTE